MYLAAVDMLVLAAGETPPPPDVNVENKDGPTSRGGGQMKDIAQWSMIGVVILVFTVLTVYIICGRSKKSTEDGEYS
jgi:hypothetical protein